jgi:hypothetical protein
MDENDIARSLGRVEGKVDLLIALHTDTSKRLASVEKRVWWATGAAAVVGAFFTKLGLPYIPH